jgi:TolA-binding protein
MKKFAVLSVIAVCFVVACQSPKEKAKSNIYNLEADVQAFKQPIDSISDELINAYTSYYDTYKLEDTTAKEYLYKAIEMGYGKMQIQNVLSWIDTLYQAHPEYKRTAEALFLKAFILENYQSDTASARKYYELVIEKYPESVMAKQAELSIPQLGKSADEIVAGFQQK